jgi:hypothetical protein
MNGRCRCGREWYADWVTNHAYMRICRGCERATTNCDCPPLEEDPAIPEPPGRGKKGQKKGPKKGPKKDKANGRET